MEVSTPRERHARRGSGATKRGPLSGERRLTGVGYSRRTNDDDHEYDGDGRRMRSKLAGASDWTEFVHDELTGEILMEYTLVGGTFTIKAVNTWGLGLISTNREGVRRYFHFDGLGSTRALTDSSETVTDTYEYNAFGVLESSTGTSVNPFRYVGQYGYYDDGAMGSPSDFVFTFGGPYDPTRDHTIPARPPSLHPGLGGCSPPGWVRCDKATNDAIHRFCHCCYRRSPSALCKQLCHFYADWYYRKCKGTPGRGRFQPWRLRVGRSLANDRQTPIHPPSRRLPKAHPGRQRPTAQTLPRTSSLAASAVI